MAEFAQNAGDENAYSLVRLGQQDPRHRSPSIGNQSRSSATELS
jgi:hypothetical protein